MAEEIRFNFGDRHSYDQGDPSRGLSWLEQATQVTESEPIRLKAGFELVARSAAMKQFEPAKRELEKAADNVSPVHREVLNQWQNKLSELEAIEIDRPVLQKAEVEESFRLYLERARDKAAQRGAAIGAAGVVQSNDESVAAP